MIITQWESNLKLKNRGSIGNQDTFFNNMDFDLNAKISWGKGYFETFQNVLITHSSEPQRQRSTWLYHPNGSAKQRSPKMSRKKYFFKHNLTITSNVAENQLPSWEMYLETSTPHESMRYWYSIVGKHRFTYLPICTAFLELGVSEKRNPIG